LILKPGNIIHAHCNWTTPPKYKFLVVAAVTPKILVFPINSRISDFIKARKHLLQCQVVLHANDYQFLKYDSFANCVNAVSAIEMEYLRSVSPLQLRQIYKGSVTASDVAEIVSAMKFSPAISSEDKGHILKALESGIQQP
jgi:hypothetical protein